MSNRDDFFDDLLGGTQPGVEGVLRDLRRLADQPAPPPGTELAAFLAAPPAGVPTGRLSPLRLRITRLAARTASMGAVGAIVLGGGAVAMACVGAVTVAHVTSPDPKPPASVSTLLPGHAKASESPEAGATQPADGSAATAQTAPTGPSEPTQSLRPSEPADHAASTANHTDGQGQDDQRADVHSGGPVDHQGDQWRQGFGQGFGGPKAGGGPSGTGGTGGTGGPGHSDGGQQGGGH